MAQASGSTWAQCGVAGSELLSLPAPCTCSHLLPGGGWGEDSGNYAHRAQPVARCPAGAHSRPAIPLLACSAQVGPAVLQDPEAGGSRGLRDRVLGWRPNTRGPLCPPSSWPLSAPWSPLCKQRCWPWLPYSGGRWRRVTLGPRTGLRTEGTCPARSPPTSRQRHPTSAIQSWPSPPAIWGHQDTLAQELPVKTRGPGPALPGAGVGRGSRPRPAWPTGSLPHAGLTWGPAGGPGGRAFP